MPTRRTWTFLIVALIFYFFANQTQVGWFYVISNALVGLVVVAFVYSWRIMKRLEGTRRFLSAPERAEDDDDELSLDVPTFHEDDPIVVTLQITNPAARALFGVSGQEHCPFAPVQQAEQPFFIPHLFKNQVARLRYETSCDRRGVHRFDKIRLTSGDPFGFFRRRRHLDLPAELLIYPAYQPIKRLRLLESHKFAQQQVSRRGTSGEVIGVREYRPGDSPRTVHWRSSARAGRLIVKEFADEEQPTLTVALDLSAMGNVGEGKYSTFETAIRMATSFGYYATQKKMPFRLLGVSPTWRVPRRTLSWWAILNYLAKVQNDGDEPYERLLEQTRGIPLLIALVSHPNEATINALRTAHRGGTRILAFFITPDGSLPPLANGLQRRGLNVQSVSPHNWGEILDPTSFAS
jgi:uncharacterized protein (DUF58 family)